MTELFTHFNDTIISSATSQGNLGNDDFMRPYIERINEYVLANQNNVVIHKNKTNQTLSNEDIDSLELILFDQIGTKEEYVQTFTILHLVD